MNKEKFIIYIIVFFLCNLLAMNDSTAQWQKCRNLTGSNNISIKSIMSNKNNIIALTVYGIFQSSDEGQSWLCTSNNTGIITINGDNIYCPGTGISVSTDYGIHWAQINDTVRTTDVRAIGNSIAAAGTGPYNLYKLISSSNSGQTWFWDYSFYRTGISSIMVVGNDILVRTYKTDTVSNVGLFIFGDKRPSWRKLSAFIYSNAITYTGDSAKIFFGTVTQGLYLSTDRCGTWEQVSKINYLYLLNYISGYLYAKDPAGGLMRSSDNGKNWVSWNEGLNIKNEIKNLTATDSNIYLLNNKDEIWQIARSGHSKIIDVPKVFLLSQNYPNPFNAMTTINFNVLRPGEFVMTVFDISGNKVEEIYNGSLDIGTYEMHWDASKYSSGVYFCRLKAGDYTDTKKMLLVK